MPTPLLNPSLDKSRPKLCLWVHLLGHMGNHPTNPRRKQDLCAHSTSEQVRQSTACRMAMQCLAAELAPHRILVNEVAPGKVDAGLSRKIFDATPGLREKARNEVPAKTLLAADDVARGVSYLFSPETLQATGSVLLLDGGLSLVRPV